DRFSPTARGVAFVINRQIVRIKPSDLTYQELVAGRALYLEIPWQNNNSTLRFLAVYAPNQPQQNEAFWKTLKTSYTANTQTHKPHFLLGDFNLVEEAIDRLPPHPDKENQVDALQDLKNSLQMIDGWRNENPNHIAYTWSQTSNTNNPNSQLSKSRIDRIYIHKDLMRTTNEWEIRTDHPIETDHDLVTAKYYDLQAPFIGKGRWEIPNHLLEHKDFTKEIHNLCTSAIKKIEQISAHRTQHNNPQLIFYDLKKEIIAFAKKLNQSTAPKIQNKINELRTELSETLNNHNINDLNRALKATKLEEEIRQTETKRHNQLRLAIHTKYHLENETIGKTWIQANKEKKPRDTLWGLRNPQNPEGPLATTTREMTNIAVNYHQSLQTKDLPTQSENEQEIEEVLTNIRTKTDARDKAKLAQTLDYDEVSGALMSMPNGKASGLDGIPTEFWKNLATDYQKAAAAGGGREDLPPDIVKLLLSVYNDIKAHGVDPESNFAEGWMCPIYKKKDKTDIANYRPITVLN
ncbi:hypothetical protein EST38_g14613, partial [Candolleomyces aberdarensis]